MGQAKPAASPPQNASEKPVASRTCFSFTSQSSDSLPAFRWLQEERDTQTGTKPHQWKDNLFKINK